METQHLQMQCNPIMTDPEWIALESLDEETKHFIFDDAVLLSLRQRGLVEPADGLWRVTARGHRALSERNYWWLAHTQAARSLCSSALSR
ncbi:hypothetical protein AB4099_08105 [Bosea sp. 2KB_26]|uniref:hypothetical protein n=1 Tax=Bosea sp. 2KB_26 TaxID=3237475 RepID=UPI003F919384